MDNKNTINRRDLLKTGLIASASTLAGCRLNGFQKQSQSSNINLLFVFTDQHSRDMLSCYGNNQLITENIDEFARNSIKFNHCVSSNPVCTPYRGMLMTGRHPLYNGCFANDVRLLRTGENSFADVLSQNGYETGYFGKWHLYGGYRNKPIPKGPHRHGFKVFKSNNCHLNYQPGECFYYDDKGNKHYFQEWEPYGQTHQACDFIKQNKNSPFAAFVSWHPPHKVKVNNSTGKYDPRAYINGTTEKLLELYNPENIKLRPNVKDTHQIRKVYQGYMAMITGIDDAFGSLIKHLKNLNLYDNTIIVFTADHGDMLKSGERTSNKGCPEFESVGVPLIIKLPHSLRKATSSDLLIGSMDIMPTLLSLMNISPPNTVQGRDLSRHIKDGTENAVNSIPLMHFAPAWRGVYTKRYTYSIGRCWAPTGGPAAANGNVLYDRQEDPWEIQNHYKNPSYKKVKKQLAELNNNWLKKFEDQFWDEQYLLQKLMGTNKPFFNAKGQKGVMTKPDTMPINIL